MQVNWSAGRPDTSMKSGAENPQNRIRDDRMAFISAVRFENANNENFARFSAQNNNVTLMTGDSNFEAIFRYLTEGLDKVSQEYVEGKLPGISLWQDSTNRNYDNLLQTVAKNSYIEKTLKEINIEMHKHDHDIEFSSLIEAVTDLHFNKDDIYKDLDALHKDNSNGYIYLTSNRDIFLDIDLDINGAKEFVSKAPEGFCRAYQNYKTRGKSKDFYNIFDQDEPCIQNQFKILFESISA